MGMNKKGQFYILAAVILCSLLIFLIPSAARIHEPLGTFTLLHQNYVHEANRVINQALYEGVNVTERLDNFTDSFIAYSKTKDINFKLLTLLTISDDLFITNRLNESANITTSAQSVILLPGTRQILNKDTPVKVTIDDFEHNFNISSSNYPQLKAIFRTSK